MKGFRVDVIDRETGELKNELFYDEIEFAKWTYRAGKRGYRFYECGGALVFHDGEGPNNFKAYKTVIEKRKEQKNEI